MTKLAELKALMAKATQGRWDCVESADDDWSIVADGAAVAFATAHDWPKAKFDAKLISVCHNITPDLIAAVEALKELIKIEPETERELIHGAITQSIEAHEAFTKARAVLAKLGE